MLVSMPYIKIKKNEWNEGKECGQCSLIFQFRDRIVKWVTLARWHQTDSRPFNPWKTNIATRDNKRSNTHANVMSKSEFLAYSRDIGITWQFWTPMVHIINDDLKIHQFRLRNRLHDDLKSPKIVNEARHVCNFLPVRVIFKQVYLALSKLLVTITF